MKEEKKVPDERKITKCVTNSKGRAHTHKNVSFRNTWVSVLLDIFEISKAERFKETAGLKINVSPEQTDSQGGMEQKPLLITIKNLPYSNETAAPWKDARAIPVFRAGTKAKRGNYRAFISMSVICKIIETIVG